VPKRENPSYFERRFYSPVEGDAQKQFEELHWGNPAQWATDVTLRGSQVQQRAVYLGDLRALVFDAAGYGLQFRRPYPWLVVGERDNKLYLCGPAVPELAVEEAFGDAGSRRELYGIYYSAAKGGKKRIYWTHDFEDERPTLAVEPSGFPRIVGGSYFVATEGIVG
jgi:hypothetical protein